MEFCAVIQDLTTGVISVEHRVFCCNKTAISQAISFNASQGTRRILSMAKALTSAVIWRDSSAG